MILDKLTSVSELRVMSMNKLAQLAKEVREEMIATIMNNGGHLASNLGVVELTIALHSVFNTPKDKLIFDVGHQAYTHKILTGRYEEFKSVRLKDGISGFPKITESEFDTFGTGHSSTSLSIGCGFLRASKLNKEDNEVIAIIGDGALGGGLVYEALNDLATIGKKMIIIVNDNNMAISKTTGAVPQFLRKLKLRQQGVLIEYNINYISNIDGNNFDHLFRALEYGKECKESIILHIHTQKGYGMLEAMKDPLSYHSIGSEKNNKVKQYAFTNAIGDALIKQARINKKVVACSAAMVESTGLLQFKKEFPNRVIDVGIAEEHAVTMCCAMAVGGYKPYFCVYSSFLQRAYDQIVHDMCIQNLPVTLCIDHSGAVNNDGETHQGMFDISYLSMIPNMTIVAPKDYEELDAFIEWSVDYMSPLAIRYPKGSISAKYDNHTTIQYGKWELSTLENSNIFILAVGAVMYELAVNIAKDMLDAGIQINIVNARFVKPLDGDMLDSLQNKHLITLEDNIRSGGFGEACLSYYNRKKVFVDLEIFAFEDQFIKQGNCKEILEENGLNKQAIIDYILKI